MIKIKKLTPIFSLLYFLVSSFYPIFCASAQFNPQFIISDQELTNYESMRMDQIQEFLEVKNSPLAKYIDPNIKVTAAQIIYDTARLHKISPRYILTLLQKEQSLVTDQSPSTDQYDWATGYGICDSCSKGDPGVQKYKGFFSQVDWGAGGTRFYYDNPDKFKFQVGETYTIDSTKVTIKNDATRALYTYTPHLHGNELLSELWKNGLPSAIWMTLCYKTAKTAALAHKRRRKPLPFKICFFEPLFFFLKSHPVKPNELDKYPVSSPIEHPNYSLLQIPTSGIFIF